MGIKSLFKKNKNITLRIGQHRIFGNSSAVDSKIGDFTYISPNTYVKNTTIGKFCSIASNCIIGESDHPYKFLSTSPIFYHKGNIFGETWTNKDHIQIYKQTTIGNDVWIGAGVFIKSGITIGDGAVIAAGAVVIKDVEPYQIVGGVPAKCIKKRFSDQLVKKLIDLKWWDWDVEKIKRNQQFFVNDDENLINSFIDANR